MNKQLLTVEDACRILGRDYATEFPEALMNMLAPDEAAYRKIKMVVAARNFLDNDNKIWEPNWNDPNEYKYSPWPYVDANEENPSGVGFSDVDYDYARADTDVGARLVYKTSKGMFETFEQFKPLYQAFLLISK